MLRRMGRPWLTLASAAACALVAATALAQDAPPTPDPSAPPAAAPPPATYGTPPAAAGQPPPQQPPPQQPPPQQPPPQQGYYPQQPPPQQPPPQQPPPQQGYYPQQPPPQQQPYPQQPPPQQQVPPPPPPQRFEGQVSGGYQEPPAYPEQDDETAGGGETWSPTGFSVRLDPLNWLIEGRLGFELELGLLPWLTVEMIPVLVANEEPPSFNLSGRDDTVRQESNGIGPFSGASLGVGFWLGGEAFRGYVIRLVFTNYGYSYIAEDSGGVFDQVDHTERRFVFFFGSYSRWGLFTIGGGLELGYELNQQERCDLMRTSTGRFGASNTSDCDGELRIAIEDRTMPSTGNLNGFLHPVALGFRFSLGLAFD